VMTSVRIRPRRDQRVYLALDRQILTIGMLSMSRVQVSRPKVGKYSLLYKRSPWLCPLRPRWTGLRPSLSASPCLKMMLHLASHFQPPPTTQVTQSFAYRRQQKSTKSFPLFLRDVRFHDMPRHLINHMLTRIHLVFSPNTYTYIHSRNHSHSHSPTRSLCNDNKDIEHSYDAY